SRAHGQRTAGGKGDRAPSMPPMNTWAWFLLLLLLNFLLFRTFFADADPALTIPYTVFKEQVVAGNVAEIYNQGQRIEGRFIEPVTYPPRSEEHTSELQSRDNLVCRLLLEKKKPH